MTLGAKHNWPMVQLGSLADFRNGVNYNKDSFGLGIKVVGVSNFQNYLKPKYEELEQINPDGIVTERNILHHGDIVFVRSNGNRELIGRSLIIENPAEKVTHSAFTIRLRFTSPNVCPKFYAYCFRTNLIRQALTAQGGGTNINNLNQDILSALLVPAPSLPTQERVASILSAYDDLIENCQRRIKILEQMARAIYREWFVNFRYPGHEAVPLVDSPLGPIPQGWRACTIGDISAFINRGISPSYADDGGSIVLNQKCIRDQKVSFQLARRQNKQVPSDKIVQFGDVLINSTGVGTLGRVAALYAEIQNCTADSHITIARAKSDIDIFYYGSLLTELQPSFERLGIGATGQTELSRASVSGIEVIVPPNDLQHEYGKNISSMRLLVKNLQDKADNLRRTRDLLLPRLLSGQIDLSEADPAKADAA